MGGHFDRNTFIRDFLAGASRAHCATKSSLSADADSCDRIRSREVHSLHSLSADSGGVGGIVYWNFIFSYDGVVVENGKENTYQ